MHIVMFNVTKKKCIFIEVVLVNNTEERWF